MSRPKVVVLGNMTDMPVAGITWLTMPYVVGLERLGFEAYYVESHAIYPRHFHGTDGAGSAGAAAFIDRAMRFFGMPIGRFAYHALHHDGRVWGMSDEQLRELYRSAALVINLHGGTDPLPEHYATGRLVLIDTDPVGFQVDVYNGNREVIEFLAPHSAFFTWGENFGRPDCKVPQSERFPYVPTRMPILCDLWQSHRQVARVEYTTIGNWSQVGTDDVVFDGELYTWTKHSEFEKFIDLPSLSGRRFELALASVDPEDRAHLEGHGWNVIDAWTVTEHLPDYRTYIASSCGEFTVAKDQNVRLRSGWFSDRSAAYLAAGRPIVTQDTGFTNTLPTGEGLFAFTTVDDVLAALDAIDGDYERHCRAARTIAREFFDAGVVLGDMLSHLDLIVPRGSRSRRDPLPDDAPLEPLTRRPTLLEPETAAAALCSPLPAAHGDRREVDPAASVVVVTYNNLLFTRMCLESVLASSDGLTHELIVVDNASRDGSAAYLRRLAERFPQVRPVFNDRNLGFGPATNAGLGDSRGDLLVLLNNDTIVAPGWLDRLRSQLQDPDVGLVGAVTNRIGTEAQTGGDYTTYGDFLASAARRAQEGAGERFELPMAAMFCVALRRDAYERIGPLDERFVGGFFEDDDYSRRAIAAGYRVVCAHDVLVHHFGEVSFGALFGGGDRDGLFKANRRRFEEKWGVEWESHEVGYTEDYEVVVGRICDFVGDRLPADATVVVVSKGDPRLAELGGRQVWHFPTDGSGRYAGHYPADSDEAIGQLELLRKCGADFFVVPDSSSWWLDYYDGFARHLASRYPVIRDADSACIVYALKPERRAQAG